MKRSRNTHGTSLEPLESRQMFAAAGTLDTSFSGDGKQVIDLGGGQLLEAFDVAVQSDGKTVVVGKRNFVDGRRSDFATARLNLDGSLDKTFGPNKTGVVTNDPGNASESFAEAVAIQADGKIVVVGTALVNDIGANEDEMAIVRYLPDGRLDKTFDGNGMRTLDLGNFDSFTRAHDVAIQSDGKIVVVGMTYRLPDNDFFAVRFNSDGKLDGNFDGDGKKFIGFGNNDEARRVAINNAGKIYVVGNVNTDRKQIMKVGLTRLNSNGDRDGAFAGGQTTFAIPGRDRTTVTGVLVQGSKLIISGHVIGANNQNDFYVARFNADGTLDKSFGGQGTGFALTDLGGNDISGGITNAPAGSGFFVSGGSGGLAVVKYTANGLVDTTFGTAGKVRLLGHTGVANIATGSGRRITLAGGPRFRSARILDAGANVVSVGALDSFATEGANDKGSLLITRSERLPVSTRIFFDISGTATPGVDYTDKLRRESSIVINGKVLPIANPRVFVDIPAHETFVVVPVTALDDTAFEGRESATFTITQHPSYELGTNPSATIDIGDNDSLNVNFQAAGSVPAGYQPDLGQAFGNRGNGLTYGWDADNSANTRIRNNPRSPDFRFDSFNHMQKDGANRRWEIAVPNGLYEVTLVAGDPNNVDSVYKMSLEGKFSLSGKPADAVRWIRSVVNIQVNDGRLTVTNTPGAVNNKIAFVEIRAAGIGAKAGAVDANRRVSLAPLPQPPRTTPTVPPTVFSQVEI